MVAIITVYSFIALSSFKVSLFIYFFVSPNIRPLGGIFWLPNVCPYYEPWYQMRSSWSKEYESTNHLQYIFRMLLITFPKHHNKFTETLSKLGVWPHAGRIWDLWSQLLSLPSSVACLVSEACLLIFLPQLYLESAALRLYLRGSSPSAAIDSLTSLGGDT